MNGLMTWQRLVWKEYRALRQLWAMTALGIASLSLIGWMFCRMTSPAEDFSWGTVLLALYVPLVYMLAALATMFAGEREEGTLTWLTMLAPGTWRVMLARLGFAAVSTVTMQGGLLFVAAVLNSWWAGRSPTWAFTDPDVGPSFEVAGYLLVAFLLLGWCCSLQSARSLNAILAAAVTFLILAWGALLVSDLVRGQRLGSGHLQDDRRYWYVILIVFGVPLAVVSHRLLGLWLQGRPWDWTVVTARLRGEGRESAARKARRLPAEAREPWRRVWQRLVWLEWQSLRAYRWFILLGVALGAWAGCYPFLGGALCAAWLIVALAGFLAWSSDQHRAQFRMMSTRGIPVHAVWLNKLVLWGLAAVVASAATIGACLLTDAFIDRGTSPPHLELPEQNFSNDGEYPSLAEVGFRFAWWCGLTTVAVFVLAFTASQLFPKAVLVVGATMIGSIGLVMWLAYTLQLGLLTLAMPPVIVWLLLVGERSLSWWWAEHVTWRLPWRRWLELATLSLFPLLLLPALGYYRAWAVPTPATLKSVDYRDVVQAPFDTPSRRAVAIHDWGRVDDLYRALPSQPSEDTANRLLAERRLVSAVEDLENVPSQPEIAGWDAMEGAPLGAMSGTPGMAAPTVGITPTMGGAEGAASGPGEMEPSEHGAADAMATIWPVDRLKPWEIERGIAIDAYKPLVEIAEILSRLHVAPPETKPRLNVAHDVQPLLHAAILALEEDRPADESIKLVTGALKLAVVHRQFAAISPQAPWMIEPARVERLLLRWAEHPRMTESTLRGVLDQIAWIEPFHGMSTERIQAQKALELAAVPPELLPWDRARYIRIVDVLRYNRERFLITARSYGWSKSSPTLAWRGSATMVQRQFMESVEIGGVHWLQHNPAIAFRPHPDDRFSREAPVIGLDEVFISELLEPLWGFRVLLVKMALHGWWRIHGGLPESLAELEPWFAKHPAGLIDPRSHQPFGYAPRTMNVKPVESVVPGEELLPQLQLWHKPTRLTDQLGQSWDGGPRVMLKIPHNGVTESFEGVATILRMPLPPEME